MQFLPHVAEQLRFYVYLYIDPRDKQIFYVGKGQNDRCFAHLYDQSESEKVHRIQEIQAQGKSPEIMILRHNLPDAATALLIESVVIDLLNRKGKQLTNEVSGHGSEEFGLTTVDELNARYGAPEVRVDDSALLIRVNRNFRFCTSDMRLYEYTRGIWNAKPVQRKTKYACAVYAGVVREVYEIEKWCPAGSTTYFHRSKEEDLNCEGRWEFIGQVAPPEVREKYRFKSVKHYLRQGNADPLVILRE